MDIKEIAKGKEKVEPETDKKYMSREDYDYFKMLHVAIVATQEAIGTLEEEKYKALTELPLIRDKFNDFMKQLYVKYGLLEEKFNVEDKTLEIATKK